MSSAAEMSNLKSGLPEDLQKKIDARADEIPAELLEWAPSQARARRQIADALERYTPPRRYFFADEPNRVEEPDHFDGTFTGGDGGKKPDAVEYPNPLRSRLFNPYNKAVPAEQWARIVGFLSWGGVSSRHVLDRHGYPLAHIQEPSKLFKHVIKDEDEYAAACDALPEEFSTDPVSVINDDWPPRLREFRRKSNPAYPRWLLSLLNNPHNPALSEEQWLEIAKMINWNHTPVLAEHGYLLGRALEEASR